MSGIATSWGESLSNKIAAAQSWPANRVAAGGLLLFVVAWTMNGVIAGAGRALHIDVLEAYAWGKEFQLGTIRTRLFGPGSRAHGSWCSR